MIDKDRILEKIKKIMALSSSSNEAEATLALEKAQELMAQYGLSERDVHLSSVGEARSKGGAACRPAWWENNLANVIAGAFGCDFIHSGGKNWVFIGIKPRDEVAAYAFSVLYRQGKIARAEFIKKRLKRCSRINKVIRANSFSEGWVRGLRSKVMNFAGTHEEEKLIEAYVQEFHPNLNDLTVSNPQNSRLRSLHSDYWKGSDEGKNAQLHHAMSTDHEQPSVRRLT